MTYTTFEVWLIIVALGIGTFLIRFSFLGIVGRREMPPVVLRLLRYTPLAVLPALVAPLVVWPEATGGAIDPVRILAAMVVLIVGIWKKHVLWSIGAGAVTLYAGLFLTGQF